jgi:hypothetical protein
MNLKARFSEGQEIPEVLAGMVHFSDDLSTVTKLPERRSIDTSENKNLETL